MSGVSAPTLACQFCCAATFGARLHATKTANPTRNREMRCTKGFLMEISFRFYRGQKDPVSVEAHSPPPKACQAGRLVIPVIERLAPRLSPPEITSILLHENP